MSRDPKTEAWTLFADSQQLTDAEQLALSEAFEDSAAGTELAADQRVHRMLCGMRHIDETRDDFISRVEQACADSSRTEAELHEVTDRAHSERAPSEPLSLNVSDAHGSASSRKIRARFSRARRAPLPSQPRSLWPARMGVTAP